MPDPVAGAPAVPASASSTEESGNEYVNSLVLKYGTPKAALAVISEENVRYRDRHRFDTAELNRIGALVPKEGHVVLPKVDADELAAFRALGKKPDELKTIVTTELPNATKALAEMQDGATFAKLASIVNVDTLRDLAGTKGFKIEKVDVKKVEGKADEVTATIKKADGTTVSLTDFMANDLKMYEAALKPSGGGAQGGGGNTTEMPGQTPGGGKANTADPVAQITGTFVPPSKRTAAK
jgi:hypothetical protein